MTKVAIVTDSTATLPQDMIEKYSIQVANQIVIWGEETFKDGIDIQPNEFYHRLSESEVMPTTSQASVVNFQEIFTDLHEQGFDILNILISHKLSGTIGSAQQAKEMLPDANIEIVDSYSAAMGLGFQVLAVARLAAEGAEMAECKSLALQARDQTGVVLAPETLEYLHRGGRIGGATRFLGTALNIRPILEVRDGRIEPVERARTRKKVLNRLIQLTIERVGGRKPVRLASLHANSPEDAKLLLEQAKNQLDPVETIFTEVSPAIGTHTGPGTVGLVFMAGL